MDSTTAPHSPPKKHGKNAFLFVIITVALDMLGFGIIIPVVPSLIQELLHIEPEDSTIWIGLLSTSFAMMNFLFAPLLGALSDKYGRRPVLLVSIAMLCVNFLISALATTIWMLFIGRLLTGVSSATHSTANAYIADVTEPENRAKAFGMLGAAFGFGFVFGPVLGGFIGEIGPRAPFFAAAALAGINFLYGFFVLPESLHTENRRPLNLKRANPLGAVKHFSKLPHISWFLLAAGILFLGHTAFPSTWAVHGEIRYDWSPKEIGFTLGIAGVGTALVQAVLMGKVIKRFGPVRTVLIGVCIAICTSMAYAFAVSPIMFMLIIPFASLAGVANPAMTSIMSNLTPSNAQGELQGATASLNSFAMTIGPLMMSGILWYFTHDVAPFRFPGVAFFLAGCLSALALIPFLRGARINAKDLEKASAPAE